MKITHSLVIAVGAVSSVVVPAAAADETVPLAAPEIRIDGASEQRGWYLRGDVGYGLWRDAGTPQHTGAQGVSTSFDEARFGRPVAGAIGVGYRVNDIFRADITGELFASKMDGTIDVAEPCSGSTVSGTTCSYGGEADFHAYGLMLNGYIDIANVVGFTPYVGAGIGMMRVVWDDFSGAAACSGVACGTDDTTSVLQNGESSWRFSYALMAGVTYALTDRLKLDVGYRYSDIAGGPMFRSAAGDAEDDGIRRHEVRVGLNLSF